MDNAQSLINWFGKLPAETQMILYENFVLELEKLLGGNNLVLRFFKKKDE